ISSGALSMGHGKALLGLKEKSMLEKAVQKMVDEHLNVRQAEQLVISLNDPKPKVKQVIKKDPFVLEQESSLREILGTNVKINKNKNKEKSSITIHHYDKKTKMKQVSKKDPFVLEQESNLREILSTNVKINKNKNKEKGSIAIDFYDKNDFDRLLQLLSSK